MLPSSGYFRNIPCPFFTSGFCERPHCHFKHEKKTIGVNYTPVSVGLQNCEESLGQKSSLLQYYSDAIKKLQDELKAGSTLLDKSETTVSVPPVTYIPTPVNKVSAHKSISKLETINSVTSDVSNQSEASILEYKPTPIAQLNKLKGIPDSLEYIPLNKKSKTTIAKKRKNHEEYDPTKVVPSKKKLKTIVENNDSASSDSEIDTGNSNVQFSDGEIGDESLDKNLEDSNKSPNTPETSTNNLEVNFNSNNKYDVLNQILIGCKRTENLGKIYLGDSVKTDANAQKKESVSSVSKKNDANKNKSDKTHSSKEKTKSKEKNKATSGKSEDKNHKKVENPKTSKSSSSSKQEKTSSKAKDSGGSSKTGKSGSKVLKSTSASSSKNDKHNHKTGKSGSDHKSSSSSSSKNTHNSSSKSKNNEVTNSKKHSKTENNEGKSTKHTSKTVDSGSEANEVNSQKENHHKVDKKNIKSSSTSKSTNSSSSKSTNSSSSKSTNSSSSKSTNSSSSKSKHSSEKSDKKEEDKKSPGKSQSKSDQTITKSNSHVTSNNLEEKTPNANFSSKETEDWNTLLFPSNLSTDLGNDLGLDLDMDTTLSNNLFKNIEEKIELEKLMEEYGSELDEHDTEEECWRIFNEEQAPNTPTEVVHNKEKIQTSHEAKVTPTNEAKVTPTKGSVPSFSKKRFAHQPAFARDLKIQKKDLKSPAEVLQMRYQKLQEMYMKTHSDKPLSPPSFINPSTSVVRKRISHVPNAALIAAASQRISGKYLPNNTVNVKTTTTTLNSAPEGTIAITNPKGAKRVAHVPSECILARPKIPVQPGSKVPHNTRQRYLDVFIEECLKFCTSAEDAFKKALEEEKIIFMRSSNKNVYLNLAVNTVRKLRGELNQPIRGSGGKYSALAQKQTVSHEYILAGAKAAKTTYSIERKPKTESVLTGAILYKLMAEYLLTQEQLEDNGYPLLNPDHPGKAIFKKLEISKRGNLHNPLEKTCCRCQKWYRVDKNGNYVTQSNCSYHYGRLYKRKVSGSWESRYSCCDGDHESIACCEADGHVHEEFDPDKVTGFMQTFSKASGDDDNYGVYALDCEMCYTTQGIELTRITVINESLKPVFESFVKPDNKVLDYNTRFSGITEDDLKNVSTTIRDVQAILLSMFSEKTILIGHSLESDFRALRLIHYTVVDTSIVFPHKNGPPFKRALRTLVAEHLKKIIQNSVEGHDSQEDAASCMELMLWKIKQDMFKRR